MNAAARPSFPLFGPTESYLGEEEWPNRAPEGRGRGDDEVVAASGDPLTSGEADQRQAVAQKGPSTFQRLMKGFSFRKTPREPRVLAKKKLTGTT